MLSIAQVRSPVEIQTSPLVAQPSKIDRYYASEVLFIAQKRLTVERLAKMSRMRHKTEWYNIVIVLFW